MHARMHELLFAGKLPSHDLRHELERGALGSACVCGKRRHGNYNQHSCLLSCEL